MYLYFVGGGQHPCRTLHPSPKKGRKCLAATLAKKRPQVFGEGLQPSPKKRQATRARKVRKGTKAMRMKEYCRSARGKREVSKRAPVKGITIVQPYANLVVGGMKTIEVKAAVKQAIGKR